MRELIILLGVGVFLLLDWYVFQAIKLLFQNGGLVQKVIYSVYWGLAGIAILTYLFYHFGPKDLLPGRYRYVMLTIVFMHYFSKLFGVIPLLFEDIFRGGKWLLIQFNFISENNTLVPIKENTLSRAEFIAKTSAALVALPFTTMSFGIISGAHDYRVRHRTVPVKGLAKGLDGLRIAQLSDIHVGSFINKKAVKGGIQMLLDEKPDLFLFTGDLVNNKAIEMKGWADVFSKVKAPLGSFSVTGNHDYGDYVNWGSQQEKKANFKNFLQLHKELGWDMLMNEHRILNIDGTKLAILGNENWGAKGRFPKYGDLKAAHHGTEDADMRILLSHDPSHWDAQVRNTPFKDIELMLAGHTHGMQFGIDIPGLRWSPVQYMYEQWADLYQKDNQFLYVNRGFGYIGYPGRIGMLPEIAILELKSV